MGKGKRSQTVKDAVVRNGAVHLAALGGAGALMASSVKALEVLCWEDLGCEGRAPPGGGGLPPTVILTPTAGSV